MRTIPPGKPGQILVMGEDGHWHWIDASDHSKHERMLRRFVMLVASVIIMLLISAFVLCLHARAADLPGGFTCVDVRYFASAMDMSPVWNRERTRTIAASYGYVLTEAHLDELEKCFTPQPMKGKVQ